MKKLALLIACITLACVSASGQNLLKKLGERAKNAAENNIGNKVERGVNDILDGKVTKADKKAAEEMAGNEGSGATSQEGGKWFCPECGAANTGKFCVECGTRKPDGGAVAQAAPQSGKASISWNAYDFVSGDEIIFEDTVEEEQLGEFPSKWDLFEGYAQVAEMDGVKCIALADQGAITPLFNDGQPYLTEAFTIEYDVYVVKGDDYGTTFNPHIYRIETYLPTGGKIEQVDSRNKAFRFDYQVSTGRGKTVLNEARLSYRWPVPGNTDYKDADAELNGIATNAWHHVAISFNKRAYKVYFDENRVINIPNAAKPDYFWIAGTQKERVFFIKNVRISSGAVPLYDRLASDGKIVTYAITFDTGKATIKPESTGEINRIKGIMDKDPSLKFEVQSHCDNTGSDKVNDPLSQKRAEAIVARLVELGISADRLTAVGKGSHAPIADNSTDEGRAKNRRVEFVKR